MASIPGDANEIVKSVPDAVGKEAVVWTAGVGADEPLLRAMAQAGGGVYEDASHDRGLRSLISELRRLAGVATAQDVMPDRITFWLLMLAVLLLL